MYGRGEGESEGLICTTSSGRYNRRGIDHRPPMTQSASRDFEFVQSEGLQDYRVMTSSFLITVRLGTPDRAGGGPVSNVPTGAIDPRLSAETSNLAKECGKKMGPSCFNRAAVRIGHPERRTV